MSTTLQASSVKRVRNAEFIPQLAAIVAEGRSVQLRARGWSMRPFVEHERDVVLIAPCDRAALRCGDVVLAKVSTGHFVLHRIVAIAGDVLQLEGDGNVGQRETCQRADVIGKAEGFFRKGRSQMDRTDGWKWRLYSALWLSLRPLRRYLLAAYRRLWLRWFPPL